VLAYAVRRVTDPQDAADVVAETATSPHWPILRQMAREGGWTQVLVGYAKAMPNGTIYGHPLVADVKSGLGCGSEWGVKLGP